MSHTVRSAGSRRQRIVAVPELGDAEQLRRELRAEVAAEEAAVTAERMQTGARVIGRRAVMRQSWRACPASHEPRRNLRPELGARCQWARIEAIGRNREFLAAYREARTHWLAGAAAQFPAGTYWLRRFAHVPLAS